MSVQHLFEAMFPEYQDFYSEYRVVRLPDSASPSKNAKSSHPKSANGKMHRLGYTKYTANVNGKTQHFYVKGDMVLRVGNSAEAHELAYLIMKSNNT
jgi:hypothetical protein